MSQCSIQMGCAMQWEGGSLKWHQYMYGGHPGVIGGSENTC